MTKPNPPLRLLPGGKAPSAPRERAEGVAYLGDLPSGLDAWLDAPRYFMLQKDKRSGWASRAWSWGRLLLGDRAELVRHAERSGKDGPCLVFGEGVGPDRSASAMKTLHGAVVDVDEGSIPLSAGVEWARAQGLMAVGYTSHSHMSTESRILFDKLATGARLPSTEDVRAYLKAEAPGLADSWLAEVEVTAPRVRDGAKMVTIYSHPPKHKWRLVLPLAEPFDLDSHVDRRAGQDRWAAKLRGIGAAMGVPIDPACLGVQTLFFLPSCRPHAPRELVVTLGTPLDLDAMEEVQPSGKAGAGKRRGLREEAKTAGGLDLNRWHRVAGKHVMLADLLEAKLHHPDDWREGDGITDSGARKGHLACPFREEHTDDTPDTATMVTNAPDDATERAVINCLHGHCQGRETPEMLAALIARSDLDEADLFDGAFYVFADEDAEAEGEFNKLREEWAARAKVVADPGGAGGTVDASTPYPVLRATLAAVLDAAGGDPRPEDALKEDWAKRNVLTKTRFNAVAKQVKAEMNKAKRMAEAETPQKGAGVGPFRVDGTAGFKAAIAYARQVIADLNARPSGPEVFLSGNTLVTLASDPHTGAHEVVEFTPDALTALLTDAGDWRRGAGEAGGTADVEAPSRVAVHLLQRRMARDGDAAACPPLLGIIPAAVFGPSGRLILRPGYDEASGLYLAPPKGFVVPPVPAEPTDEEVDEGRRLLVDVFADFPFAASGGRDALMAGAPCADLAAVLGWMVTPLIRPLLGSTALAPALYVGKPSYGAGASLVVKVAQIILTGTSDLRPTLSRSEDTQHKEIVAALASDRPFLAFDNATTIAGGPLAVLLTGSTYSGRTLGRSETRAYPNRLGVAFTGANAVASRELQRRLLLAWIDPEVEVAHERTGFRHADLEVYAAKNRGPLYAALCVLVARWIARGGLDRLRAGTPTAEEAALPVLGSYPAWSLAVGGILEGAGITGLLANRAEVGKRMADTADVDDALRDLVEAWLSPPKGTTAPSRDAVQARDLAAFADDVHLDLDVRQRPSGVGMEFDPKEFGKWLGRVCDRVVTVNGDPWRVERAGGSRDKGGVRWALRRVPPKRRA